MPVPVNVVGRHFALSEDTDNDSDKTITLTDRGPVTVIGVRVVYAASATPATRQLVVQFQKPDGTVILEQRAGATQAAGETRYYQFGVGLSDMTAFARADDFLTTPIPPVLLDRSWKIRVFDNDGTAVASDDMEVHVDCTW